MSTRSQTLFIVKRRHLSDEKKPVEYLDQALIYRHSDGYPEGIIPDLLAFLKWNDGRNEQCDYMAANWIYWNKKQFEKYLEDDFHRKHYPKGWEDPSGNNIVKLGMGVDEIGRYHSDIEYFYKVIVVSEYTGVKPKETITIEVYDPDTGGDEVKIPKKPFATVEVDPTTYKPLKITGLTKEFKQKDGDDE